MNRISVAEHSTSEPVEIVGPDLQAIGRAEKYVQCLYGGSENTFKLKARQWVGEFRFNGFHVSIIPKIGPTEVLKMFLGGDGEARPHEIQSSLTGAHSLPDVIAENFLREFQIVRRAGLERKYLEVRENSTFCKGQVQIFDDIKSNVPVRSGVFCQFDELSRDTLNNRVLLSSLIKLSQMTSATLAEKLIWCSGALGDVPHARDIPQFNLPGRNSRYRKILHLCKLIQAGNSQESVSSGYGGASFALDMNKVFEGFVREQLREYLMADSMRVLDKERVAFCDKVAIDPDVRVIRNGEVVLVADAKYKRQWNYEPGDVYQMLAYLEHYESAVLGVVIFPADGDQIVFDHTMLPRNRKLARIGIPVNKLLSPAVWSGIYKTIIDEVFVNNR